MNINFRFLKIPVIIHPSFWLSLLIFIGSNASPIEIFIWGSVFSITLLVHEYGHGLTVLYFGKNPEITLIAFGGFTKYSPTGLTEKQRFLITLNGPLFDGILILLAYFLLKMNIPDGFPIGTSGQYMRQMTMFSTH